MAVITWCCRQMKADKKQAHSDAVLDSLHKTRITINISLSVFSPVCHNPLPPPPSFFPCFFNSTSPQHIRVRTKTSCWWESSTWATCPSSLPSLISACCQIECISLSSDFYFSFFGVLNVPLLSCLMLMVLRKLTDFFFFVCFLLFPRVNKKKKWNAN